MSLTLTNAGKHLKHFALSIPNEMHDIRSLFKIQLGNILQYLDISMNRRRTQSHLLTSIVSAGLPTIAIKYFPNYVDEEGKM